MKISKILLALLLTFTLSACGNNDIEENDAMNDAMEEKENTVMIEESDDILELNMENALLELDLVE